MSGARRTWLADNQRCVRAREYGASVDVCLCSVDVYSTHPRRAAGGRRKTDAFEPSCAAATTRRHRHAVGDEPNHFAVTVPQTTGLHTQAAPVTCWNVSGRPRFDHQVSVHAHTLAHAEATVDHPPTTYARANRRGDGSTRIAPVAMTLFPRNDLEVVVEIREQAVLPSHVVVAFGVNISATRSRQRAHALAHIGSPAHDKHPAQLTDTMHNAQPKTVANNAVRFGSSDDTNTPCMYVCLYAVHMYVHVLIEDVHSLLEGNPQCLRLRLPSSLLVLSLFS